MKDKYIGIKPGGYGKFESTNLDIVFTRQVDGNYKGYSKFLNKEIIVSEKEILHDLKLNYLQEYEK